MSCSRSPTLTRSSSRPKSAAIRPNTRALSPGQFAPIDTASQQLYLYPLDDKSSIDFESKQTKLQTALLNLWNVFQNCQLCYDMPTFYKPLSDDHLPIVSVKIGSDPSLHGGGFFHQLKYLLCFSSQVQPEMSETPAPAPAPEPIKTVEISLAVDDDDAVSMFSSVEPFEFLQYTEVAQYINEHVKKLYSFQFSEKVAIELNSRGLLDLFTTILQHHYTFLESTRERLIHPGHYKLYKYICAVESLDQFMKLMISFHQFLCKFHQYDLRRLRGLVMLLMASISLGKLVQDMIAQQITDLEIKDEFPIYVETLPTPPPNGVDITKQLNFIIKAKNDDKMLQKAYPVYREIQDKVENLPYLIDDLTNTHIVEAMNRLAQRKDEFKPITIIEAIIKHVNPLLSQYKDNRVKMISCSVGISIDSGIRLLVDIKGNRFGVHTISMFDPYNKMNELVSVSKGNMFDDLNNGLILAFTHYPVAHNHRFTPVVLADGSKRKTAISMTVTGEDLKKPYFNIKVYSDMKVTNYEDEDEDVNVNMNVNMNVNVNATTTRQWQYTRPVSGGAKKRVFLAKLNKKELQERAKTLNIKGVSKMNKADLILAIRKKR